MAKIDTFHCSVITPERAVIECDARFVAFPAHDGERGVLPNHAPLLCKMGIGRLRVETPDEKHTLFVDGGFAQIADNRLTILSEQARRPAEIDVGAVTHALADARAMRITDDESSIARDKAIKRAKVQMKIARAAG